MMPGASEWAIILGIALLLFGPKKLPQLGGAVGESIRNFKRGMQNADLDKIDEEGSKPLSEKTASKAATMKPKKSGTC